MVVDNIPIFVIDNIRFSCVVPVDRKSVLGNPYFLPKEGDRDFVISTYEKWLRANIEWWQSGKDLSHKIEPTLFVQKEIYLTSTFKNPTVGQVINELKRIKKLAKTYQNIVFQCWCYPQSCHSQIIEKVLKEVWNLL